MYWYSKTSCFDVFDRYFGCRVHACCSFFLWSHPWLACSYKYNFFLFAIYILTRSWEKLEWEWKSISWKACFFTTPICMVAVGTVLTRICATGENRWDLWRFSRFLVLCMWCQVLSHALLKLWCMLIPELTSFYHRKK